MQPAIACSQNLFGLGQVKIMPREAGSTVHESQPGKSVAHGTPAACASAADSKPMRIANENGNVR
jgi:hypothetical protein